MVALPSGKYMSGSPRIRARGVLAAMRAARLTEEPLGRRRLEPEAGETGELHLPGVERGNGIDARAEKTHGP